MPNNPTITNLPNESLKRANSMTIDLLNAQQLIPGETYLLTLPDMEPECMLLISAQLEKIVDQCGVKFVVLCGDVTVKPRVN
jgi:hypothetical protein